MATIARAEIIKALEELGRRAQAEGTLIELLLVGGSAMVLLFGQRDSTRDIDAKILSPLDTSIVRRLAIAVAHDLQLPEDWLNDGAKGYLYGESAGSEVLSKPGIIVRCPSIAQLLAMKLCAWRDDVDITDARCLLGELPGSREEIWQTISVHLLPGRELKAMYAFADLWEDSKHDND